MCMHTLHSCSIITILNLQSSKYNMYKYIDAYNCHVNVHVHVNERYDIIHVVVHM